MSNHDKGRKWARAVELWLIEAGFTTLKRPLGEAGDDIKARRPDLELSVEAKNRRAIELSTFVDQTVANAGPGEVGVTVIHRRGRSSVDDAYFVLDGRTMRRLLGGDRP